MSLLRLNDLDVLTARVSMPRRGTWVADVRVDSRIGLEGPAVLASFDGRFRLPGVIERGGVERDAFVARLVGGRGGLELLVPARSYRFIPARTVFSDLLAAAGEGLSPASDGVALGATLPYWTQGSTSCSAALSRLADALDVTWRVLPDGTVWVGRETWTAAPSLPFEVLESASAEDRVVLGVEGPWLLPGATLLGRRVSLVVHTVGDGGARSEVWFERAEDASRLFGGLRRWLEKALHRMDTLALYPARVVSQNDDGTLEVKPDSTKLPGLSRVRIKAGLPGVLVRVESGARVVVAFEEGDPCLPVAILWEDARLIDLRVGGERGVARIADSVVVPIPNGYEFKANVVLGVPAAIGNALYPNSTITILPSPKALNGTIVTGSAKLKA